MTLVAAGPTPALGDEPRIARAEPETVRLLNVPYVPQTEALCGGAAVAMVLRYWGEPAVVAEDFVPLLEPNGAGIRTAALVAAVRARGWTALPVTGSAAEIRTHLARGRPLIALIAAGPGSFHYVVLLAMANGGVILHDPATAPFRTQTEREFDDAWAAGGRWALLILPSRHDSEPGAVDSAVVIPPTPLALTGCDAIVADAVTRARTGDPAEAERRFRSAAALCPESAAPTRGLAGLRFAVEDWAGATRLAERALVLDPTDRYTWRLLAASRFLLDDETGALRAWNTISEPHTDLPRVDGLDRIRYRAVAAQLDLPPGHVLTARAFIQARRRLAEIPALSQARLRLRPLPSGSAQVNAALLERPLFFDGALDAGAAGVRALVDREATLHVASPMGHGELWTMGYRWPRARPRASLGLAIPSPDGRPGIWRVEGSWERQAYAGETSSGPTLWREERRRSALSFADWVAPDLRLELGGALDTWAGRGAHFSIAGSLDARFADDRLAVTAQGAQWTSLDHGAPFRAGSAEARWGPRQRVDAGWLARLGASHVTADAPLALWSGAGTGQGRAPLLRAHPLLHQGVVTGRVFGRTLVSTGVERQAWAWSRHSLRVGWSLFVDGARAFEALRGAPVPWQVDAGGGIRIAGPGTGGEFRLVAAHGLEDGRSAFSVVWVSR